MSLIILMSEDITREQKIRNHWTDFETTQCHMLSSFSSTALQNKECSEIV